MTSEAPKPCLEGCRKTYNQSSNGGMTIGTEHVEGCPNGPKPAEPCPCSDQGRPGHPSGRCESKPAEPKCATCGDPATCLGAYEMAEESSYSCDTCCGHGNEDGECVPVRSVCQAEGMCPPSGHHPKCSSFPAKPTEPQVSEPETQIDPLQTMDAQLWAKEFIRIWSGRWSEVDEALMIGWFANAIMRGFDEANRRSATKPQVSEPPKSDYDCTCSDEDHVYGGCPVHDVPENWQGDKNDQAAEEKALHGALKKLNECFEEHREDVDLVVTHLSAVRAERDSLAAKLKEREEAITGSTGEGRAVITTNLIRHWSEESRLALVRKLSDYDALKAENAELREKVQSTKDVFLRQLRSLEDSRPLCPDCRDKQRGKDCLGCTIQSQAATIQRYEDLIVRYRNEQDIWESLGVEGDGDIGVLDAQHDLLEEGAHIRARREKEAGKAE